MRELPGLQIRKDRARRELSDRWEAITKLSGKLGPTTYLLPGAGLFNAPGSPDGAYSLLVLLANGILEEALRQARREGQFPCDRGEDDGEPFAKELIHASEGLVAWSDAEGVLDGVEKRNRLAHRAELLTKSESLEVVDRIGAQLRAWGLLT